MMRLRATLLLRNEAMIAARERLGLSQSALGKRANVPIGFIMRCEKLDYPKRAYEEKVIVLATFLKISVDDIVPTELVGETIRNRYIQKIQISPEHLLEYRDTFHSRNILPAVDIELSEAESLNRVMDVLSGLLQTLSHREREILKLRFGLDGEEAHTLEEVGRIFRVCRDRVRQIEAKAIRKLQQPWRSEKLAAAIETENGIT